MNTAISILGIFVADTTYRANCLPRLGETVLGNAFALGPGGKGSNQAVAAARLGGNITLTTRLGDDAFADMAEDIWRDAGVKFNVVRDPESYTGAACVFIENTTGDNAIIVCPGAANDIDLEMIDEHAGMIRSSRIFMTQLEQPIPATGYALRIAHNAGVTTVLNPAPAAPIDDQLLSLCDYLTPNETEASELTGLPVKTIGEARLAADALLRRGVENVVITLGEQGALLHNRDESVHIPAFDAGSVVETTGAGDAFNGAMAVGLASGLCTKEAVRLGCATAGLSVTRPGAAASMPTIAEVQALMKETSA